MALARLFHGRVYLDASTIQWLAYDALGVAPALTNSMLGGPQPAIAAPAVGRARKWLHGWRILTYSRRAIPIRLAANTGLPRQAAHARAWAGEALPDDTAALGRRLREQFTALLSADDLFFLQGSAGGTLSKLLELVEAACPGQSHALTAALMAGGAPSVTAAQSYALMDLAALARDDAAALAWLRAPDRRGSDWRDALPPDSPFRRAFADFLERYGHRAVYETYLRHPRWREAPDYLLDSVLNLIGADPAALRARQEAAALAAWRTLNAALPCWKRPLARLLIAGARLDCRQREAARSVLVGYVAAARRCALALGERCAGPGGLAAPDDVFHLSVEELLALADGALPADAAARRAAWRRTQLQQWAGAEDPDVVEESDGGALAGPCAARRGCRNRSRRRQMARHASGGRPCARPRLRGARSGRRAGHACRGRAGGSVHRSGLDAAVPARQRAGHGGRRLSVPWRHRGARVRHPRAGQRARHPRCRGRWRSAGRGCRRGPGQPGGGDREA